MSENLKKEKNQSKFGKGLLLWGLVLTGYFIFVFNWVIMNKLIGHVADDPTKGSAAVGWIADFFTTKPSSTTTQAVNYTITAMRGLGAVGAGFVLAKIGHKYAVIIALGLLSLALPAVFFGRVGGTTGYSLFIIGRMLMAIGGTVLIVYTQPIISRFFSPKQKGVASAINSVGFNLGAALPLILFMIDPIRTSMLNNWELWAAIVAGTPIIILLVYLFVGENIEIKAATTSSKTETLKPATWGSVAKEKNTWKLSLLFGCWIVLVVAVILIMPGHFFGLHQVEFGKMQVWEKLLPIVLFLAGLIPGIFLVSWVNKHQVDRRKYISLITSLALIFIIVAYVLLAKTKSVVGPSVMMFLAGICAWGIQGAILMIPHELKGNSPQRVAIMIGFVWGIGYLLYTVSNIIMAVVFDAIHSKTHPNLELASWIQFGIFAGLSLLVPTVILTMPKTSDKGVSSVLKAKFSK